MRLAIHHREGSYSNQWIPYCQINEIPFKIVNCYSINIIQDVKDCDALLWHHHHGDYRDVLFAKQLIFSLEQSGIKVFPNYYASWHFDDKVGQKYLFESLGIPHIPTYIFYDKATAMNWCNNATFPKVFKLRGGAGSANVELIKNVKEAKKRIKVAFGKGFKQFNGVNYFLDVAGKYSSGVGTVKDVLKGFGRIFISTEFSKMRGNEKGYIYFQEFIPKNEFDIRVIVISGRAFAIKRMVRENDFRASGSGVIHYEKECFSDETIKLSFKVASMLKSNCCAMDFIFDQKNNAKVVEISYGFSMKGYEDCVGYWDTSMFFHEGSFNPYGWMIDDVS